MAVVDIEIAHDVDPTPHSRRLGALVGVAAIVTSLLGVLQMDASTKEAQASSRASRLSAEASRDLAINGLVSSFVLPTHKDVIADAIAATGRVLAALEAGVGVEVATAASEAETGVTDRLIALTDEMAAPPGPESGVDRRTLESLNRTLPEISARVDEQNRQADRLERYGKRGDRSVLALSLAAVGAVLLGLAGIVGAGRAGTIVMASAAGALILATAAGASALLI